MIVKLSAVGRNLNRQAGFVQSEGELVQVIVPINADRPAATDVWIGKASADSRVMAMVQGITGLDWGVSRRGGLSAMSFTVAIEKASLDLHKGDRITLSVEGPRGSATYHGFVNNITSRWDADNEVSLVSVLGYSSYKSVRISLSGEEDFWRSTTNVLTTVPIDRSIAGYLNTVINGFAAVDGNLTVDFKGIKNFSPIKGFTHSINPAHDVSRYKFSFDGAQWYEIVDNLVDFLNAQSGGFNYYWNIILDAGVLKLHVGQVTATLSYGVQSAPYRILKSGVATENTVLSYAPSDKARNDVLTAYYVKTLFFSGYIPSIRDEVDSLNEELLDLGNVAATEEEITPFVNAFLNLNNNFGVGDMEVANMTYLLSPWTRVTMNVVGIPDAQYEVASVDYNISIEAAVSGRVTLGENVGSLYDNMKILIAEKFTSIKGDTVPPSISLTTSAPSMTTSASIGSPAEFFAELKDEDTGIDESSVVLKVAKLALKDIPADNFDPGNPEYSTVVDQIDWDAAESIPMLPYFAKTYNPITGEELTSERIHGAFYVATNLLTLFTRGDIGAFRAYGRDNAGNVASTEPQFFQIDKDPPTVSVNVVTSTVASDTTVKPDELLAGLGTIEVKVTDASTIEFVKCDYNIGNTTRVAASVDDLPNMANLAYDPVKNVYTAEISVEPEDGPVKVAVYSQDKFGNLVKDDSLYVIHSNGFDGEAPSLSVSLEYPDDYIVQASQIGADPVFCFKMSDTESGVKGFSMAIRRAGVSDWEWVTPYSSWFKGIGYYRGYGEIPDDGLVFPQFSEELDSEYMLHFRNNYNTPLTPEEQVAFAAWLKEETGRLDRLVERDLFSYDMQGYWKDVGSGPAPGDHYPDTYKKPNHPTFSSDSMYHGDNHPFGDISMTWVGGTWTGDTQFTVSENMQRYTHPRVWLDRFWVAYQQGILLVYAPCSPLNTQKYLLLGSAADIHWKEADVHKFVKFTRGMYCFDIPYVDVGDVSVTPRVGISVDLFSSGIFHSGDTCQFKFAAIDAEGNLRESEERTYVVDTAAPKPTIAIEDVPDDNNDSKVSYQQISKKFKAWISVAEKSPLTRLEVHRMTRYNKLSAPPGDTGEHYKTIDVRKWIVPGVTPGPNYDPASDRYFFIDDSHRWHNKYTAWVIAEDAFGKVGYSPVLSLEGVDADEETSGSLTDDIVDGWGDENTGDPEDKTFDGSNIKGGTVYWEALKDVPFLDHAIENGWTDPGAPNSGWAGKRVRFGWNKQGGKLVYGWYNKAVRVSADVNGTNVTEGTNNFEFHPIFEIDSNGIAVGIKTAAYFTDG